MKKIRILFIVAVIIASLIPVAVYAQGVWYCSTLIAEGGNGSYAYPWACGTNAQFDYIVYDVICEQHGGGFLYRIYSGSYVFYEIGSVDGGQCDIIYQNEFPGYPPDTGVELPMPLILGAVAVGGSALLLTGLALRRRKVAS